MSAPQTFTAAVHREEDWYVAQCLEVDVASTPLVTSFQLPGAA
jgi:hypothetical protein